MTSETIRPEQGARPQSTPDYLVGDPADPNRFRRVLHVFGKAIPVKGGLRREPEPVEHPGTDKSGPADDDQDDDDDDDEKSFGRPKTLSPNKCRSPNDVPGWLRDDFAAGYAPADEPPGLEELYFRRWRELGGRVTTNRRAAQPERFPPPPGLAVRFDPRPVLRPDGPAVMLWEVVDSEPTPPGSREPGDRPRRPVEFAEAVPDPVTGYTYADDPAGRRNEPRTGFSYERPPPGWCGRVKLFALVSRGVVTEAVAIGEAGLPAWMTILPPVITTGGRAYMLDATGEAAADPLPCYLELLAVPAERRTGLETGRYLALELVEEADPGCRCEYLRGYAGVLPQCTSAVPLHTLGPAELQLWCLSGENKRNCLFYPTAPR